TSTACARAGIGGSSAAAARRRLRCGHRSVSHGSCVTDSAIRGALEQRVENTPGVSAVGLIPIHRKRTTRFLSPGSKSFRHARLSRLARDLLSEYGPSCANGPQGGAATSSARGDGRGRLLARVGYRPRWAWPPPPFRRVPLVKGPVERWPWRCRKG